MIDRAYLLKKRAEHHDLWVQAMAVANANHGAMEVIDEMLAKLDADAAPALDLDQLTGGSVTVSALPGE